MRAWPVDADDIRVTEDFDDALLHRTPEIDAFLTPDRDDSRPKILSPIDLSSRLPLGRQIDCPWRW
jgi:hypothetical protein